MNRETWNKMTPAEKGEYDATNYFMPRGVSPMYDDEYWEGYKAAFENLPVIDVRDLFTDGGFITKCAAGMDGMMSISVSDPFCYASVVPSDMTVEAICGMTMESCREGVTKNYLLSIVVPFKENDRYRVFAKHNTSSSDRWIAVVSRSSVESFFKEVEEVREREREISSATRDAVIESISMMEVDRDRLLLPSDIVFKNYNQVKAVLMKAGGKYSGNGFTFKGKDASEIRDRIVSGEKVDDKKKYQFFATKGKVKSRVIELAEISHRHDILEPSAGHGDLVDGLDKDQITCFEVWGENVKVLQDKGYHVTEADFLKTEPTMEYDRIVANPPFTKNQDIDHVRHMYEWLKPGGRMVSVTSTSWRFGTQKKQREFREWLEHVGAEVELVDKGAFKESGTNIETCIVVIEK